MTPYKPLPPPKSEEELIKEIKCCICGEGLGLSGEYWEKFKKARMHHIECSLPKDEPSFCQYRPHGDFSSIAKQSKKVSHAIKSNEEVK